MPKDVRAPGAAPDQTPGLPASDAIATQRTPGFDVARALAILGMVLVNYKGKLEAASRGDDWLVWLSDRLDGRAAALFVVLAGVGVSLRSARARQDPKQHLAFERMALCKRAAVLFVTGLLLMHLWDWDILHCYGLFLLAAALLLKSPGVLLWLLAAASVGGAALLQASFDYERSPDFWTPSGAFSSLLFNGAHPFFPWIAFVLVGMWAGRLDLNDDRMRRRLLMGALIAACSAELLDSIGVRAHLTLGIGEQGAAWLSSWVTPPRPLYVVAASGTALAVICLCIQLTRFCAQARWVVALTATGQLAFTLYILHAIAILIPLKHGLFEHASLLDAITYGLAFYGAAVALSLWWRKRFPFGPLEALIRQITGRTAPAPWGGQLVGPPRANLSAARESKPS